MLFRSPFDSGDATAEALPPATPSALFKLDVERYRPRRETPNELRAEGEERKKKWGNKLDRLVQEQQVS